MTEPRGLSPGIVLVLVVTVVAGALVLDRGLPTPEVAEAVVREEPLLAGSATCAAVELGESSAITATTVVLPADEDDPWDGIRRENPAAELDAMGDGEVRALLSPDTTGNILTTAVEGDAGEIALSARWRGTPLLLARRWEVDETQRVPGAVEGPCPADPMQRWVVPGVITAGGAAASLHLANPTAAPASLSVSFTSPTGPIAPTRLANIAVPAYGRATIDLNEFVPEEPDLGVVVEARAGRVVVEAVQTLEAAVGGVDGRSLVVAHPTPAETWTIPWVEAGADTSAWVWVTNPGERPTDVRLVLHTQDGPVVPPATGVTLLPGTTQRIDLRAALEGQASPVAVTVRSDPGVPVVASAGVLRAVEDDAVRGGYAAVEAVQASDGPHAALTAVGGDGRTRTLLLTNPGEGDAEVRVLVATASGVLRTVVDGFVVPAGSVTKVDLGDALPGDAGAALLVEADVGVVAAALATESREGPLDLTAVAARPFPAFVSVRDQQVRRDDRLLHPIRVPDGTVPVQPADTSQQPDPSPTPDDVDGGASS